MKGSPRPLTPRLRELLEKALGRSPYGLPSLEEWEQIRRMGGHELPTSRSVLHDDVVSAEMITPRGNHRDTATG